eukprot:jgi/Psemu1/6759/gm1.6759_g
MLIGYNSLAKGVKEFNEAWDSIGKLDLPGEGEPTNKLGVGHKYFWKKLQDAFNDLYCELFVRQPAGARRKEAAVPCDSDESAVTSGNSESCCLSDRLQKFAIDDFKVYFVSLNKETAGLKISPYTRQPERTATTNLLKGQLTDMVGGDGSHMSGLEGFELGGDRAYNKKVVVEVLLKAGAQLNGTKAMTLDRPFVRGK